MANIANYPEELKPLGTVVAETRSLMETLKRLSESIYQACGVTTAGHGVLSCLSQSGPQTVPQMAKLKEVSRQHIQTVVNKLLEGGLVTTIENPSHKRSPLIWFMPTGTALLEEIERREIEIISTLEVDVPPSVLKGTARVLKEIKRQYDSEPWSESTEEVEGESSEAAPETTEIEAGEPQTAP